VNLSAGEALKVPTTELTDDVVQLLGFVKPALADNPWKHSLDLVCHKLIPSLAMEVTLHKASLNSLVARVLSTVVWVALLVLEMSLHLAFCVKRVEAVIIAALEGFEWSQLCCHSCGLRCSELNAWSMWIQC
jgi:hypothetical protein